MNYLLTSHLAAEINGTDYGPAGLESLAPRIAGALDHRPSCRRPRLILLVRPSDQAPVLRCSNCGQYMILRGRWLFDALEQAGFNVGPDDWTKAPPRARKFPLPQEAPPPAPARRLVSDHLIGNHPGIARYWCRDHPDQPVDHRGRGCPECAR